MLNDNILKAVDVVQRAQRNYDRSRSIPQKDLDTLIYAAENSPSKQNETHYQLNVYTNDTIEKLYRKVFPSRLIEIIKTDAKTACFIKYFCKF